jgi:glycopeptide antibiotics resistance protein
VVAGLIETLLGGEVRRLRIEAFSPSSFVLPLILLYFLRRKGKSAGYLVCFYLFSVYLWAVLAYTLIDLPIWSVEVGILRERGWWSEINLIPTPLTGKFEYWSDQVYGNFLLGLPFGLGVRFVVARRSHKQVILLGLAFAVGIELAQLLIGLVLYQAPYRVLDIDDVWLVFGGTLAGYAALWRMARVYRLIGWKGGARLPVWSHFHEVLLHVASNRVPDAPGAGPLDLAAESPEGKLRPGDA